MLGQYDSSGSDSIPGQNDPLEAFYSKKPLLTWSRSILGLKGSLGIVLSQDSMTPLESFYPRTE